ncbi:hypothetical protein ASZ90_003491 [hydrocarbon metagenome]|uniref:Tyr recombinase domain-containing protein n=1 Tax=hydrocarbon metagenome TaxID=938273 RepID=A0A0W8G0M5_9ZZZZ
MDGLSNILNKLSVEDVEKLKILFSLSTKTDTNVKDAVTLRVFCDEYKSLIKQTRTKSYYRSVETALNHLTEYFGLQKLISSLSHKDIEQFVTHLQQHVKKGYRVYYRTLKAAFNKAIDWQYVDVNHFVKIKLPKKQKLNPLFITEQELEHVLNKIDVDVVRDVVVFGYYTGLRLSEIVNLKWKNVDLNSNVIIVGDEVFETKGKNQRYVPICDEVRGVLESRTPSCVLPTPRRTSLEKGEKKSYVFCKENGERYTGDYFSKRFKKACRDAGLNEAYHFHSLRHSFASNLAQRGVSIYVIKDLLGHSSISTTEIYSHLNVDSLREAVGKLNKPPLRLLLNKGEKSSSRLRLVSGGKL